MTRLRIAVTGFVSAQAGSVASANALLLTALLDRGCEIVFFSKASFVDPRPVVGGRPGFQFVDVDNRLFDRARALLARVPGVRFVAGLADAATYNRMLVREIGRAHAAQPFDLCLWLGDYAKAGIAGLPTVSFAQGPPGTDARSLRDRFSEIAALAGSAMAWKWRLMAAWRLSPAGGPSFRATDRFIIGSEQSRATLCLRNGISSNTISVLPYPIDLEMFQPSGGELPAGSLQCLWLGRIIPRKRLDLLLDGAAEAIDRGCDLQLTIVGDVGFVPGYEKLIANFSHPDRLEWVRFLPREKVPALMRDHDVLVQPSEEENFGSSVAEAQACGLPVVVGATNGNRDYLCPRDTVLDDYRPETLAAAFLELAARKRDGRMGDPAESRRCADRNFAISTIADQLGEILESTVGADKAKG